MSHEKADSKDGIGIQQSHPRRRNVKGPDLRALIGRTKRSVRERVEHDGTRGILRATAQCGQSRTNLKLLVPSVGILEPGAGELQIELDRVLVGKLDVKAVE